METIKLSFNKISNIVAIILLLLSFTGCATISTFNQQAYSQTISLKVDALNIMDLAIDDYSVHEKTVKEFQTQLQKIYEYEKNRPKNKITIQQWDKLLDKNGHLLGGFLNRWDTDKKLGETYIAEAKKLVDKAFDQIAGLESRKLKPSDISK
jgi:hypothetical protein